MKKIRETPLLVLNEQINELSEANICYAYNPIIYPCKLAKLVAMETHTDMPSFPYYTRLQSPPPWS